MKETPHRPDIRVDPTDKALKVRGGGQMMIVQPMPGNEMKFGRESTPHTAESAWQMATKQSRGEGGSDCQQLSTE
jgi:hypothetical protein